VRSSDSGRRRVIGEAAAGHPFPGSVAPGEAVRIFTGAVVPDGADTIVIQENARAEDGVIAFDAGAPPGRHVRPPGMDFKAGEVLAAAGRRLCARDLALLAAGDCAQLSVRTRPRIAIAATGDELSRPGEARKPGGIAASANVGLAALVGQWGAEPCDLGILPDRPEAIAALAGVKADLIVTIGGASVGDHDLIRGALGPAGLVLDFWKIAMRPGRPLLFGRLGATPLLGLPGNPVSALVTGLLFLRPAIAAMLGIESEPALERARLAAPLPANGEREDYLRATRLRSEAGHEGECLVTPAPLQDSAMLAVLARADCLIVRPPHAPAAAAGEMVALLALD
jgi:molybdopterin molybdotransferase